MTARSKYKQQGILQLSILIGILILINIVSTAVYHHFDLTKEKRFTLSTPTKNLLKNLEDVVLVKVYLEGEFPAGFKRLRNGAKEMLDEFRNIAGDNIQYEFIDPNAIEDKEQKNDLFKQLVKKGLQPTNLKVQGNEEYSEKIIFPGAIITYRGQEMPIHFLQNQVGMGPQEVLNNSVSLLEYKLANTIFKVTRPFRKKIGFILGQGELSELEIADFKKSLQESYNVDSIVLPNTLSIPKDYSAIIIAKPDTFFREQDKFKIDQFVMNGGKVLWLVETLHCDMDSLRNQMFVPENYPLNLEDQLFNYGVRINANLILDLQCNTIPLVLGNLGNTPQTQMRPWFYFPVIISESTHPISKNLDAVMTQFVNSIDTVGARGVKKTILLASSKYTRLQFAPVRVHLGILQQKPNPEQFNKPNQPIAILLEGEFESVFKNRLTSNTSQMLDSLKIKFKEKSVKTKMIVVSDGDIVSNDYDKNGIPYPLGFYRFTSETFANKDFLTNCIEYLVDENGLIETRTREVKLRLLDTTRIKSEKLKWQIVNMILPIALVVVLGFVFNFMRRKKFATDSQI